MGFDNLVCECGKLLNYVVSAGMSKYEVKFWTSDSSVVCLSFNTDGQE